jgi:hypothetical protein
MLTLVGLLMLASLGIGPAFVPCCAAHLAHKAGLAAKHHEGIIFRKAVHADIIQDLAQSNARAAWTEGRSA